MVSVLGLLRWRRCRCVPAGVSFDKESQMFYWRWFDQITFWDTVRVFRKEKKSNRRELMDGLIRQLVPVPGGQTRHMNFCCCTRLRGHLYSKPKSQTFFFSRSPHHLPTSAWLSLFPPTCLRINASSTTNSPERHKALLFTCKSCAPCPPV